MSSKRGGVLRWTLTASLLARHGYAQSDAVTSPDVGAAPFEYSSPAGCPARAEFVKRVNARQSLRGPQGIDAALDAQLHRVVIGSSSEGWVHFRDARIAPRKVTASTCDEVVTGLALIVGMSLAEPERPVPSQEVLPPGDQAASKEARPNESLSPPRGTSSPLPVAIAGVRAPSTSSSGLAAPTAQQPPTEVVTSAPGRTAVGAPSEEKAPAPGPRPPLPKNERPVPEAIVRLGQAAEDGIAQDEDYAVGLGATGGAWSVFGSIQPRGDAFIELASLRRGWAARINPFATWHNDAALSWSAEWFGYGARLEMCPVLGARRWNVGLCALTEVGAVSVRGRSSVGNAVNDARLLWADAGVGVRVGTPRFWKVNMEAQLDAVVPLTRYGLVFERPSVTLAEVPPVAFMARLGFRLQPWLD